MIYLLLVGYASTGAPKQKARSVVPEQQAQATQGWEAVFSGYEDHGGGEVIEYDSDDGKDSHGAELTSLAQSSAQQAKNAIQNQKNAGSQAAYGVASSFASAAQGVSWGLFSVLLKRARIVLWRSPIIATRSKILTFQAAQTAQAALVGKQAIIQNYKRQLNEAQQQVQREMKQYEQAAAAALSAQEASQQYQEQLNALGAALIAAQNGAHRSEQAVLAANSAAAAQQSMVTEAKQKISRLLGQISSSVEELHETEISALTAAEAAQVARSNAAAVGAAVAAVNTKGAHHSQHY
ncbi:hypothetical protein NQ317_004377 [Molorchus minor]|uniref:Uncharacterized protein n=1 Tax=Molorchus minor TaxID=1323400 RepID=A0ABQ9JTL7_9CUCU|nr:hypothetical protein NQ317_004377 [Molorchus minor]